jgi:hypothetical protein
MKFVPKDFDLLYLGCFGCNNSFNFLSIVFTLLGMTNDNSKKINKYINKPLVALGAHSYLISRKGAEKLIKLLDKKINFHIDFLIHNLSKKKLIDSYSLSNRIAYQTSTDNEPSLNVSNTHPLMFNKFLSHFYIDKKCKLSYITTVSLFRVNNIDLTIDLKKDYKERVIVYSDLGGGYGPVDLLEISSFSPMVLDVYKSRRKQLPTRWPRAGHHRPSSN